MKVRGESGQVLPIVTVMSLGLLAMVGLVVDAGLLFAARRDLQASADAAARAGASVIDEDAYRGSGGRRAVLDPAGARAAAHHRLEGVDVVALHASPEEVVVGVARTQPLLLLRLIGAGSVRVEADSTARPRTGILAPGG
jgi:hypothetical protein